MNDQELQAQNAAHLRALELSQKENQELKTKVASLQGQMQQLLKLIQGFKSERFVTQTSNHAQLELFAPVEAPTELPQQEETPRPSCSSREYSRKRRDYRTRTGHLWNG